MSVPSSSVSFATLFFSCSPLTFMFHQTKLAFLEKDQVPSCLWYFILHNCGNFSLKPFLPRILFIFKVLVKTTFSIGNFSSEKKVKVLVA